MPEKNNEFYKLLPHIDDILLTSLPRNWPGLQKIVAGYLTKPPVRETVLPLACCRAVGGNVKNALHVAAAFRMMYIFLDVYMIPDQKDSFISLARTIGNQALAYNYASVLNILPLRILGLSSLSPTSLKVINTCFMHILFLMSGKKEEERISPNRGKKTSPNIYKNKTTTHSGKSIVKAEIVSMACKAGALAGTDNDYLIAACAEYGYHLGAVFHRILCLKPINEEMWLPEDAKRKDIFHEADDRNAIMKEWQAALHAIDRCPENTGKDILKTWIIIE